MEVDARFAAGDTAGRTGADPQPVGPDDRRERPVLHRRAVGEAQPGRHRRRRQREPRARLGDRPRLEPERLRGRRAPGDRGLQDLDHRAPAGRRGMGAGPDPDAVGCARLALAPGTPGLLVDVDDGRAEGDVGNRRRPGARPLANDHDGLQGRVARRRARSRCHGRGARRALCSSPASRARTRSRGGRSHCSPS